jgi:hypothetical protein
MKNHKNHQLVHKIKPFSSLRRVSLMMTTAVILTCLAVTGKAANLLVNPGFESAPLFTAGSWTQHASETWSMSSGTAQTPVALIHTGANSFWMQGLYENGQSGPQTSYAAQDFSCVPGNTYSADAWFSEYAYCTSHIGGDDGNDPPGGCSLFGSDSSGNEDGWIEVLFYDSSDALVADYKSTIITPAYVGTATGQAYTGNLDLVTNAAGNIYLAWEDFAVTNQYDPTTVTANSDPALDTAGITNTLGSGQYITAPAGAVKVEFRINLFQAAYERGAPFWDDANLTLVGGPSASAIGDLSPDGTKFFNNTATNFTFNITSQAAGGATLPTNPTNGVQVIVNGVNKSASLQFSGTPTDWNVTLPNIYSNQVYNISITVSNSAGLTANSSVVFDTFPANAFIVNSEDYDFTNGEFIQNPIPTNGAAAYSYWGTAGTLGIDQSAAASVVDGGSTLAPSYPNRTDGNVAFQATGDIPLPIYAAQNNSAVYGVALAYNNGGDWCNYTRNPYPQGNYYVYGRLSGGAGYGEESLNLLTSGYGTATQTTNQLGEFILPNGQNWNSFEWIPLTDAFGNQVSVNIPPGRQTLQLLSGGGENFAFFVFVPVSGTLPPAIGNLTPAVNSQNVFVSATNLTFNVSSTSSTIAQSGIQTLLNGVDVSHTESITGNNTNWLVSIPLPQNQILTLVVNATSANGLSNSISASFDTFSQNNFMVNAVDYDFSGGQFIDNPVPTGNANVALGTVAPDSYYYWPEGDNTNAALAGIDYSSTNTDSGKTFLYRALDQAGTQVATDFLLQIFATNNASEFNIGWWNGGEWFNYTRTYPTNKFYVYGRLASGQPYTGLTLGKVTSGLGTPNQTASVWGSFADPSGAGWQTWHWVPLLNTNGQAAVVSLGGVETLRVTGGTGANANYYMLVPATPSVSLTAAISGGNIVVQFPTQSGSSYTVLSSSSLTGGSWQPVGSAIPGTGSPISVTNSMGQAQQYFRVLVQ